LVILAASGVTSATAVFWTPAHGLAPQGGLYGRPAACDLDGDGDQDVSFVSQGDYPATQNAQFWNVGEGHVPAWQVEMGVLPPLPNCWSRMGTYGDIDGDGDFDLISGCIQRGLRLHRNVGTPQSPSWAYDPAPVQGVPNGSSAKPCLADLDADGDLDLVIAYGGVAGAYLIENVGTPQTPQWTASGSWLPGLEDVWWPVVLGDLDLDGDLDAISNSTTAGIACFENVGTPQVPAFAANPSMLAGIEPPTGAEAFALLDVDSDGDVDLLCARSPGGQVYLYLNETTTATPRESWGTVKAMYRQVPVRPPSN
jgi:hypothetical protein